MARFIQQTYWLARSQGTVLFKPFSDLKCGAVSSVVQVGKCSKFTEMFLSLFRETTVENNQSLDQRKLYGNSCESNMPVCKIRIESYKIILSCSYLILILSA